MRTKLNFLLARLLDIAPHHFEVIIDGGLPQPHLCGWTLLHRWINHFNLHNSLPTLANQYTVPRHFVDIINTCIQSSTEDWRTYHMPQHVAQIATHLRRNFLWDRARREAGGQPVPQFRLTVAVPQPRPDMRPSFREPPSDTTSTLARLQHFQRYPG